MHVTSAGRFFFLCSEESGLGRTYNSQHCVRVLEIQPFPISVIFLRHGEGQKVNSVSKDVLVTYISKWSFGKRVGKKEQKQTGSVFIRLTQLCKEMKGEVCDNVLNQ